MAKVQANNNKEQDEVFVARFTSAQKYYNKNIMLDHLVYWIFVMCK